MFKPLPNITYPYKQASLADKVLEVTIDTEEAELRCAMNTLYYIPSALRKFLSTYYTRHWTASYVEKLLAKYEGRLFHQDCWYNVVYYNTDPTKLYSKNANNHVKCSFREADSKFDIAPVVLIQHNRGLD